MALEEMAKFFDARVEGYEQHMLENVDGADAYYGETARAFPQLHRPMILDLGCGTGLELDEIYRRMPDARVTGIDLSSGMLQKLREKHADKELTLIQGSYFEEDFGVARYDLAVSVESLHHFDRALKLSLYRRLRRALKSGGVYVETDYVAPDDEYERFYFAEAQRLRAEQNIPDVAFCHYDTPHTVPHLIEMLEEAGFARVEKLWQVTNTAILRAWA